MQQSAEFGPPIQCILPTKGPPFAPTGAARILFQSVPTCIVPISNLKSIQSFRLHCLRTPYCRTRHVCWCVSAAIDCRTITGHLCQKLLSLSTNKLNISDLSISFIHVHPARLDTLVKGGFYRMEGGRDWEHEAGWATEGKIMENRCRVKAANPELT